MVVILHVGPKVLQNAASAPASHFGHYRFLTIIGVSTRNCLCFFLKWFHDFPGESMPLERGVVVDC